MNIDSIIQDQLKRHSFSSKGGRAELTPPTKSKWTEAPTCPSCNKLNLSPEYLTLKVLLYNINPKAEIVFEGKRPEDDVMRPVALFGVANRALYAMKDCDWDTQMSKVYEDTKRLMKRLQDRFYYGMSLEQIEIVTDFYDPLEEKLKKHYDVLKYSILNATYPLFDIKKNQEDFVKAMMVHVCLQHVNNDFTRYLYARLRDLDKVTTNVRAMIGYFASKDPHSDEDIYDLNQDKNINLANRCFTLAYATTPMYEHEEKAEVVSQKSLIELQKRFSK